MRFLHPERDEQLELSLDDCFLVPAYFAGASRLEVDLAPVDFPGGSHPIVSANMNTVTGKRMAETMARLGGLGVLPQDMSLATVERIVRHVKAAHPRYDTALVVEPEASLRDVLGILHKRAHDLVSVIGAEGELLGVVTSADLRDRDQYTPAARVMTGDTVTLAPDVSNRDAFLLLDQARVKAAPVVDAQRRVIGVLSRGDAVRLELLRPACDHDGRLMLAAAVSVSDAESAAAALLELGVDALVVDTAHGHQRRAMEAVRAVRARIEAFAGEGDRAVPLIAGNVCTAQGTRDLIEAGADVVKVNVGPGAMCTTRMQTGVGRPTFSAVRECAAEAQRLGKHVWADGGVRYPRDAALYLAAGASRVMVGTLLAGTCESPGDYAVDPDGRRYKVSYGMASARAVIDRAAELDAFDRAQRAFFREGISSSRIYMKEGRESVGEILIELVTGIQSAFTYVGATRWQDFQERAVVGVQSPAGFHEGTPHGAVRTN